MVTKEERQAQQRANYLRNRETILARMAKRRAEKHEEIKAKSREYYWLTRETRVIKAREDYQKHKEKRSARARERRVAKRDELNAWHAEYYKRNKDRLSAATNRAKLLRVYGITPEQKAEMLVGQGGCCAICRVDVTAKRAAHIDHDHATGRVRGILCNKCNRALGYFGDSIENLEAAIAYLDPTDVLNLCKSA